MTNLANIDTSLLERRRILHLLERIAREDLTVGEMEEIGSKLRKSGKRALSPLVRKLWREESGELISRYTYLLDFFDEEGWLEQLIQITLRRRDLGEEGKSALLAALDDYGVDISSPPFDRLLAELGGPLRLTLPKILSKGEEGILWFLDDFLFLAPEIRLAIVQELPSIDSPAIPDLLETLLSIGDPEITAESLRALGRIRTTAAASNLRRFITIHPDDLNYSLAVRSLRRLAFLGITAADDAQVEYQFHRTLVTPFDSAGNRSLLFCRWEGDLLLRVLLLQVNDVAGIKDAYGYGQMSVESFDKLVQDFTGQEGLVETDTPFALGILQEAIAINRERSIFLPPDFYANHRLFIGCDLTWSKNQAQEIAIDRPRRYHLRETASLLDDSYFESWFLVNGEVSALAGEWETLEEKVEIRRLAPEVESLVARFCKELLEPDRDRIARRLLATADLMRVTKREKALVERTLAVADALQYSNLPLHCQPFFRRLALESMELAREALAEGYDFADADEDGEDWD